MDEFKPCPFCGGGASDHINIRHSKCCAQCGAIEGGWKGTNRHPIGWNTRPVEDALQAEIAELNERIERGAKIVEDFIRLADKLKAELKKYTDPLTDEQVSRFSYKWVMGEDNLPGVDAAIRKVRADG